MAKSTALATTADASIPFNPDQTLKASKALVAHIKKSAAEPREDGKQNLLATEESTVAETPIWLTLTTKKHIHDSHRKQLSLARTWSARRWLLAAPLSIACSYQDNPLTTTRPATRENRASEPPQHRRRTQRLLNNGRPPAVLQKCGSR